MLIVMDNSVTKYQTKYFGEFFVGDDDEEVIIETKINVNGEKKDISIIMANCDIYIDKIGLCVNILNQYHKLCKIGENEIIKGYIAQGKLANFLKEHFNDLNKEDKEKIFGTKGFMKIDIKKFLKKIDPPGILFSNENGEIMVTICYFLIGYNERMLSIKMDTGLRVKDIMYYN